MYMSFNNIIVRAPKNIFYKFMNCKMFLVNKNNSLFEGNVPWI